MTVRLSRLITSTCILELEDLGVFFDLKDRYIAPVALCFSNESNTYSAFTVLKKNYVYTILFCALKF